MAVPGGGVLGVGGWEKWTKGVSWSHGARGMGIILSNSFPTPPPTVPCIQAICEDEVRYSWKGDKANRQEAQCTLFLQGLFAWAIKHCRDLGKTTWGMVVAGCQIFLGACGMYSVLRQTRDKRIVRVLLYHRSERRVFSALRTD